MSECRMVGIRNRMVYLPVLEISLRDKLERIVKNIRIMHHGPIDGRFNDKVCQNLAVALTSCL